MTGVVFYVDAANDCFMSAYIYILASDRNGTLYIGVTTDLPRRMYEHSQGLLDGFSKAYGVGRLVYAEEFSRIDEAIAREKQLKNWKRAWKIDLIEGSNPEWRDLSETGLF
jgi:putative endonuclease